MRLVLLDQGNRRLVAGVLLIFLGGPMAWRVFNHILAAVCFLFSGATWVGPYSYYSSAYYSLLVGLVLLLKPIDTKSGYTLIWAVPCLCALAVNAWAFFQINVHVYAYNKNEQFWRPFFTLACAVALLLFLDGSFGLGTDWKKKTEVKKSKVALVLFVSVLCILAGVSSLMTVEYARDVEKVMEKGSSRWLVRLNETDVFIRCKGEKGDRTVVFFHGWAGQR